MTAPNLFLIYVQDAQRSTAFYSDLFDIEPTFTSPATSRSRSPLASCSRSGPAGTSTPLLRLRARARSG